VVYRSARAGLRITRGQRRRLLGLLVSAGDVWACVLELNAWRRARQDRPLVSYQALCRELASAGPGTFGELDTVGARSVLRRYSDAWFAAAKRRNEGDRTARFPRRRQALMPLRWYHGTFTLTGRRLRIPAMRGRQPLWVRLDRDPPYPPGQVRSVTLLYQAGRLWVDISAEVPVACYPAGQEPDPARAAGVDLGIIHPYAVAGPDGQGLLVSGRAVRAEHRMHLADRKARTRAVARRAPKPGQRGRGGGGTTGVGSGWPRRGTGGGSARHSTKPPQPSSPGHSPSGSAPWPSATPAACSASRRGDGITSAPATGGSAT
jgi:putative transposase